MSGKINEPKAYQSRITDWPLDERPRERLERLGPESVSNAELVAILIGQGTAKFNAVELAKMLLRRFKSLERLSNASLKEMQEISGIGPAKAVTLLAAFQLYRNLQQEKAENEIISFRNAYHGSTHGALSILGNEDMKYAYRPLLPGIRFLQFNNPDDLKNITSETAAVVIEPVQAEAGILIPDKDYLLALRNRCDETGTLLIFDEVQMGFGRTGKLFAFEHFGVTPDVLCLAKAMGGGMPIGAFVAGKEHMSTLTHHPALGHITTFGGHPVSCAAALASLEVILDERLAEKADAKGKLVKTKLEQHPKVDGIRQIGLMLAVEIKKDYSVPKLIKILQKNGLIVDQFLFNDRSFRIAPPLTITEKEIALVIDKVVASLNELN
jgi:acetylornithine/succinyldiaminopimelate/putrescine aminotransferase